ncbi:hypothetical protein B0H13DRAFT_1850857 [Mycena leptocephala]|nr:hypothetical protein B0H13DRAFT_1850857 [Mycena leptocephala]
MHPQQRKTATPGRRYRKPLKDGSGPVWPQHIELSSPCAHKVSTGLHAYQDTHTHYCGPSRQNQFLVHYLGSRGIVRTRKQVASHVQFLHKRVKGSDSSEEYLFDGIVSTFPKNVRKQSMTEPSEHANMQIGTPGRDLVHWKISGIIPTDRYLPQKPTLSAQQRFDKVLRFRITDTYLNVSFRRVRDVAVKTRDSGCIAILAQTLLAAVILENSETDLMTRIEAVYCQLQEEYAVRDVRSMVASLLDEQKLDTSCYSTLQWIHQVNMSNSGVAGMGRYTVHN